jgi:L,D-transpeptidase catalytic domain
VRHPLPLRYTFMWICLGISGLLLAQGALLPLFPAPILRVQVVNKGGAGKLVASGIEASEEGGGFQGALAAIGRSFFRSDEADQPTTQGPPKGQLVVDLSDRVLRLYSPTGSLKGTYDLAVGQAGWETPIGSYRVLDMQRDPAWQHPITGTIIPPGEDNPLGSAWIGFISTKTSQIGFHGTPDESAIGQPVSHGCLRMRNADVLALYPQIATGWPVRVQP